MLHFLPKNIVLFPRLLLCHYESQSRSHYWIGNPNMHLFHWLLYLQVCINLYIWLFHDTSVTVSQSLCQMIFVLVFIRWDLCWILMVQIFLSSDLVVESSGGKSRKQYSTSESHQQPSGVENLGIYLYTSTSKRKVGFYIFSKLIESIGVNMNELSIMSIGCINQGKIVCSGPRLLSYWASDNLFLRVVTRAILNLMKIKIVFKMSNSPISVDKDGWISFNYKI